MKEDRKRLVPTISTMYIYIYVISYFWNLPRIGFTHHRNFLFPFSDNAIAQCTADSSGQELSFRQLSDHLKHESISGPIRMQRIMQVSTVQSLSKDIIEFVPEHV